MRKPKTARLRKKKGFVREISLQEAFDVIAEELVRREVDHCAFIGRNYDAWYSVSPKLHVYAVSHGEETIVESTKSVAEIERDVENARK